VNRRRVLTIYVVLLHLALALLLWKPETISRARSALLGTPDPGATWYEQALVQFQLRADANLGAGAALFFGDSHVQGLCTACIGEGAANYGIGGDTAFGILNRIKHYRSIAHAHAVVLAAGYNDLKKGTVADVAATYDALLREVPASVPLVLSALFPVDPLSANSGGVTNTMIRELNGHISAACRHRRGCIFVDTAAKLVGPDGGLRRELHVGDGVHLNPGAYAIWIADLRAALAKL